MGHGKMDCFHIGKGIHQGCILSPCLFNLYANYIMWNAGLDEAGIKIAQRNINNLRYADTTLNPKRNESWIFIGRTDAEAPIFWPPDAKSWLIWKDPDVGKDWRQEKGTTEDEMVGWHHQLNGHEFEEALGDGEGQENLACCSPWGCKESDTTERLKTVTTIVSHNWCKKWYSTTLQKKAHPLPSHVGHVANLGSLGPLPTCVSTSSSRQIQLDRLFPSHCVHN